MTSIGLRPALLFFSFTGVNTAASISARKLSNGTTRAIISSGSPFAVIAASRRSASKNPNCPIVQTPANLVVTIRLAQIRGSRYFSRCPKDVEDARARGDQDDGDSAQTEADIGSDLSESEGTRGDARRRARKGDGVGRADN